MGWGALIIILFLCTSAKAAPLGSEGPSIMERSGSDSNQSSIPEAFSFLNTGDKTLSYGSTMVFTKNYILNLGEVKDRLEDDITDSCKAISTQDDICHNTPASCPMAHLNKENYSNAIRKNFQISTALGLACETRIKGTSTEATNHCLNGQDWILPQNATAAFSFLDMMYNGFDNKFLKVEMEKISTSIKKRSVHTGPIKLSKGTTKEVMWNLFWQELSMKGSTHSIHDSTASTEHALLRSKRVIVSGPIIFSIILGALATTTSAVTAHVISVNEANKVLDAEALHREEDIEDSIINNRINLEKVNNNSILLDHLRHISTHSSNAVNHVMDALNLNDRINYWLSKDDTIQYSDPALEDFSGDIRSMVTEDTEGLLDTEIESMIRLASNTETVVTTILPLAGHSTRCDNRLLMKTLYVTVNMLGAPHNKRNIQPILQPTVPDIHPSDLGKHDRLRILPQGGQLDINKLDRLIPHQAGTPNYLQAHLHEVQLLSRIIAISGDQEDPLPPPSDDDSGAALGRSGNRHQQHGVHKTQRDCGN